MGNYKEFWIYPTGEDVFTFNVNSNEIVHVIEYSAYEQLQQENDKLKMRFETALQQRNICLETMRMITGDDELTEKTKNKYDLELEIAGE